MNLTMQKEINCLNFKGLFSYLDKHYGEKGINTVIDGLVDSPNYLIHDLNDPAKVTPINREQITDINYWVSNEFSMQLLGNVRKVVKGPNPLFEAGRGAIRENLSKSALFAGKLLGPVFFAKQANKINSRFNRTKRVVVNKVSSKEITFRLYYLKRFYVTRDICNWNLGIYTELAHSAGVRGIQADEVKCVSKGDECCEIRLRWKRSGMFSRLFRGICLFNVNREVRDVIREYESSLKERDRLIDELVNSEEKYRSLFESTATANAILEADFRISLANTEFEKITGLGKKELVNDCTLKSIVKPSDFMAIRRRINENLNAGISRNLEFQIIDKKGVEKSVLCKIARIPNSTKIIASMMDVTEMKRTATEKERLQTKLVRAEKMEALGLLAGGVAHDLNNVLSGIVSYPELILMDIPRDSHLRKQILAIKDSGIKAAAIVQDLLTLARRDVAVKDVVNINDVINDYLKSAEYEKMMSFHPKVKLTFTGEESLFNIIGSPFNLFKAVMNLITNAAEATKEGGRIEITTENSYLEHPIRGYDAYREGDYVIVSVSDTGIGIPASDVERIFEPFYSKKVMGRSGTGLGMTVIWGTVNDHNGHIDVVSKEGKGTTFKLYFPATRIKAEKKDRRHAINELKGNGESILVVDDVKEQRTLVSTMLEKLDYTVFLADSGDDAVKFIEAENHVDLMILDMIMYPGIDGLETFRRIRKIKPDQRTIIVSGFSETDRVKRAQSLGAGEYIRKPYLFDDLALAVKKELKRQPTS